MIRKLSAAQKTIDRYTYILQLASAYAAAHKPKNDNQYRDWELLRLYWEEGQFVADWSMYAGCGDYDRESTTFNLSNLFPHQEVV